jgi:hypothetical protein
MICSRCAGEGEVRLLVCGTRDGRVFSAWRTHLCLTCGGMGAISDEQWVRQERGRLLREDRIGRRVTLREEASRLGISPQALSKIEWGKA